MAEDGRGSRLRTGLAILLSLGGLGVALLIAARAGGGIEGALSIIPVGTHVAAMGIFLVELACRGGRLSLLARGTGLSVSLPRGCATQLVGEAAAAITPSRAGSDPARLLVLHRGGVEVSRGGTLLLAELLAEAAGLVVSLALLALLLPGAALPASGVLVYAAGCLGIAIAVAGSARLRLPPGVPRVWLRSGLGEGRWRRTRVALRRFRRALGQLRGFPVKGAIGVVALSVLRVGARLAVLPLLVVPVAPGTPLEPLVGWPFLLLYTAALLPPPGGGGSVEVAFALLLGPHLPSVVLGGVLVWWRVYTFYLGAFVGALLAAGGQRRLASPGPIPGGGPQATASPTR